MYRLVWDDSINTSHGMDKLSVQSKAAGLDRLPHLMAGKYRRSVVEDFNIYTEQEWKQKRNSHIKKILEEIK